MRSGQLRKRRLRRRLCAATIVVAAITSLVARLLALIQIADDDLLIGLQLSDEDVQISLGVRADDDAGPPASSTRILPNPGRRLAD